jgi:Cu-Zn family superoxide dismutase
MQNIASLLTAAGLLLSASPLALAQAEHKHEKAQPVTSAIAVLHASKGSKVEGSFTFTKSGEGIRVQGKVTGLTPGKHGFHVHEFGDISSPDGTSAGGHFNPTGAPHGARDADQRHAGDFGNIEADASGVANVDFVDKKISFDGPTSILGRSVVVHAKEDDLKTQPSGDAGDRVAVGVIGTRKGEASK